MIFPSLFRSLRFQLLMVGVVATSLVMAFAVFQQLTAMRAALVENARTTILQTSSILNLALAPATATGQFDALRDFLTEMLPPRPLDAASNGLVYVTVANERGDFLIRVGQWPAQLPEPDELSLQTIEHGVLNVRQPILLKGNQIGSLQYGLATGGLVTATYGAAKQGIYVLAMGLAVMMVGLLFLGLVLTRQIEKLVSATRAVESGNFGVRAPEGSIEEFRLLARHFNTMAQAIQVRMEEVQRSRAETLALNQSLEIRVADRTKELNEKNSALEQLLADLNATRDQLIQSEKMAGLGTLVAGVAHELNTPIGNALIASSTLSERTLAFRKEYESGLRRSSLEAFIEVAISGSDLIQRNLHRASELITGFKHVAADQASSQRREFDLKETLDEIVATLAPSFKKTPFHLNLEAAEGIHLNSYPGPLGQVVNNLVNNSLVHAFVGRDHGTMTLKAFNRGAEQIEIVFEDDGVGIPRENLMRIFDPFFTTRLGQGGSGLGLHIVYNIVTAILGGEIRAESTAGKGARFVMTIPVNAPKKEKNPA